MNVTPQLAITREYRYMGAFEDLDFKGVGSAPFDCRGLCGDRSESVGHHSALIGVR